MALWLRVPAAKQPHKNPGVPYTPLTTGPRGSRNRMIWGFAGLQLRVDRKSMPQGQGETLA